MTLIRVSERYIHGNATGKIDILNRNNLKQLNNVMIFTRPKRN